MGRISAGGPARAPSAAAADRSGDDAGTRREVEVEVEVEVGPAPAPAPNGSDGGVAVCAEGREGVAACTGAWYQTKKKSK